MTFETVRELALALPEVVEGTSWGTPAFKVRKKLIARIREEGILVVIIDLADKEFLIRSDPEVHFTLPHHDGYGAVLVRLAAAGREEMARLLTASWRYVAPAKLVAASDPQPLP